MTAQWSFTTGGTVQAPAVVDSEGTVYIGSNDGSMYAITALGQLRWHYLAGTMVRWVGGVVFLSAVAAVFALVRECPVTSKV
jgi:outer membrane protein assembly factor BamB